MKDLDVNEIKKWGEYLFSPLLETIKSLWGTLLGLLPIDKKENLEEVKEVDKEPVCSNDRYYPSYRNQPQDYFGIKDQYINSTLNQMRHDLMYGSFNEMKNRGSKINRFIDNNNTLYDMWKRVEFY